MTSSDDSINRIEQVDTSWTWGPCPHPDAPKFLVAVGEQRPTTRTVLEPEPGVQVPVEYVQPDAPVTYLVTTVCTVCGGHEVWESPEPVVVPPEPEPLPPPPPVIDVTGMTCQPAPERETP